jgi:signal transduction histidine kinase
MVNSTIALKNLKTLLKILLFSLLALLAVHCNSPERKAQFKTKAGSYLDKSQSAEYSPEQQVNYIDSAYAELASGNQIDSLTQFLYRRTIAAYYNQQRYDKAIAVGSKAYNLAEEAGDTLAMADMLYRKGEVYFAQGLNDTAFIFYDQAEKLYQKIGSNENKGEILLNKAFIYYYIGEYVLSEVKGVQALEILQEEGKTMPVYSCNNLIATALEGQNSTKEAMVYYNNALQLLDKLKEEGYPSYLLDYYRASTYNNMGGVYVKEEEYAEAISLYTEALKFDVIKTDYASLYAKLLNNLAFAKFKLGDHRNLPELFLSSLRIRDSLDLQAGIVASYIHLGEYYAYEKDTAKALSYLETAYKSAKELRSHFDILNSLKLLSELDRERGMYYSSRRFIVSDSLAEIARTNREKYARIEYETDKLLDEKEALVKKNSFIIGVSAVILLFIAAIFIIYYLNSRNKELLLLQEQQKANEEVYQLMEEQQQKIDMARKDEKDRIAMELHDGILNNIYAVRLNLEFINKKTDEESIEKRKGFIKELQSVETEIRAISHDLSRNAMLVNQKSFESVLEYMITSQKNDFETLFEADINKDIDWDSLSGIFKVHIYRIVQETLQNINKYAKANFARVEIKEENKSIVIIVSDDGVGFDPKTVKGGIGIKNLKKRVTSLNGTLDINSEPGEGSVIKVVFPV